MNSNIDSVYEASSSKELLDAIKDNPDLNQVSTHPFYRNASAFEYFLDNACDSRPNHIVFSNLKMMTLDEIITMCNIFIQNDVKLDNTLFFVAWSNMSERAKIAISRILLDNGASKQETPAEMSLEVYTRSYQPELYKFLEEGYRLEKIRDNYCASIIQNWFLKKYYDPYHPYGKARLEREFVALAKSLQ